MELPSKKCSLGIAVGGMVLAVGSYFALRRVLDHKEFLSEVTSIPWDVSNEYTSWKRIFFPSSASKVLK